jgi:hypothetical protein
LTLTASVVFFNHRARPLSSAKGSSASESEDASDSELDAQSLLSSEPSSASESDSSSESDYIIKEYQNKRSHKELEKITTNGEKENECVLPQICVYVCMYGVSLRYIKGVQKLVSSCKPMGSHSLITLSVTSPCLTTENERDPRLACPIS